MRQDGDKLVLLHWGMFVVAREGDTARIGGGETGGAWTPCGLFEVEQALIP